MNHVKFAREERIRLVLADDARPLLEREQSFFPKSHYEIALARDGCEAYNLVKTFAPAVVFLDLFMPLLNGEECCRLIKSDLHLRETRVVLIAPNEERHLRRCRDAQCDLVLTKPIRRRSFLKAMHALMGRPRQVPARWPIRLAAELHDDEACLLRCWTVNLNEHGVYLESAAMPPLGKIFTLVLTLSAEHSLTIASRVVWHNPEGAPSDRRLPSGFGLQFLALGGTDRAALRGLVREEAEAGRPTGMSRQVPARMFVELPMLNGKAS